MKVLILDDRAYIYMPIIELLKNRGDTVDIARNPKEATQLAESWDFAYDRYVVDLHLPVSGLNDEEKKQSQGGKLAGWLWLKRVKFNCIFFIFISIFTILAIGAAIYFFIVQFKFDALSQTLADSKKSKDMAVLLSGIITGIKELQNISASSLIIQIFLLVSSGVVGFLLARFKELELNATKREKEVTDLITNQKNYIEYLSLLNQLFFPLTALYSVVSLNNEEINDYTLSSQLDIVLKNIEDALTRQKFNLDRSIYENNIKPILEKVKYLMLSRVSILTVRKEDSMIAVYTGLLQLHEGIKEKIFMVLPKEQS